MAHEHEDGWPLGLGLGALNARAGVARSVGSASSTTPFTTPSHCVSSFASSDVDTESTWSLPRGGGGGGGITLATLIGLVDAMESRRSSRDARASRSGGKLRALLLSLCLRSTLESGPSIAPSLGQFLEMGEESRWQEWPCPQDAPVEPCVTSLY